VPKFQLCVAAIAGLASLAAAQPAEPVVGPATLLQPLDAGTADVGSLSTSLLVTQPDLRVGSDFEHVYRANNGSLFRVQGGLVATFPQSEYVPTRNGEQAVIPAGTVFSIGPPVDFKPGRHGRPESFGPDAAPMNQSAPTDGCVSRSLSVPLARPLSSPMAIGPVAVPVAQRTLATTQTAVVPASEPRGDRMLDVSNEYYRRYRLAQISAKYGPGGRDDR
jgi:hypothetical protein